MQYNAMQCRLECDGMQDDSTCIEGFHILNEVAD
jgi:hypothetical protein